VRTRVRRAYVGIEPLEGRLPQDAVAARYKEQTGRGEKSAAFCRGTDLSPLLPSALKAVAPSKAREKTQKRGRKGKRERKR
jgi:hypothetical protein